MDDSFLPPDPYIALGVAKDASAAAIKAQYRKLVLKFHPDKVQDESQKAVAADQFHKIQSAYEIVSDDSRRQRYDAQCRLADLRKDARERGGFSGPRAAPDVRTAAFHVPTSLPRGGAEFYARGPERTDRVPPMYEERKPSYATQQPQFFDSPPRATSRKEPEYERSSKRSAPRGEKEKTKTAAKEAKEYERSSRREKSRRTDRDIRRERDHKQPAYDRVETASSESDDYNERTRRRMRDEDEERRARDAYYPQARRRSGDAPASTPVVDRAHKLSTQEDKLRDYVQQTNRTHQPKDEPERRPSPVRASSGKDNVEYVKRSKGRPPVMIRRGSGRPKTAGRDGDKHRPSTREKGDEIVDEPQESFRPPTFASSKSSPTEIRMPSERQRSKSTQLDPENDPIPQLRRADSLPVESPRVKRGDSRRKDSTLPRQSSGLRGEPKQAYPTPEHSPEPTSRKYPYGYEYADDAEYPTVDGYRTDIREPNINFRHPRYTRSPSPMRERSRMERTASNTQANTAARPSQGGRTTSTSYVYPDYSVRGPSEHYPRPSLSRENSARAHLLYGEVPTTSPTSANPISPNRSPRVSSHAKFPPTAEGVQWQREVRAEDIKFQTGYPTRRRHSGSAAKPSYTRSGSSPSAIFVK